MSIDILGISAFYHDSAACLIRDGRVVAAAQEERFTRKKFDASFPSRAARYCLEAGGIGLNDLEYIVFYDKPLVKFERLIETYVSFAPQGIQSFVTAMPVWLKEKLLLKKVLQEELIGLDGITAKSSLPSVLFGEHHESHAASAFYPSPFKSVAVLCMRTLRSWRDDKKDQALSRAKPQRMPRIRQTKFSSILTLLARGKKSECAISRKGAKATKDER